LKAVISRTAGPVASLEYGELPLPIPGPGQVQVRVVRCSINYPDVLTIQDLYQVKPPRPFTPGSEISGIVSAVGPDVAGFAVGDRVFGAIGHGGLAEYALAPATALHAMGPVADFDAAATLVMTYATAYHGLKDRGRLARGERLLVLGASGGCGRAAVELGKAMGATVVAAASSPEKLAAAEAAGADESFVYPTGPFDDDGRRALTKLIKDRAGAQGFDMVFDPVGGDYAEAALRALNPGGRLLVVGFPAGIPRIPLNLALLKSCDIVGVFMGSFSKHDPVGHAANIAELRTMLAEGAIRPEISGHLPLARGGEAIAALAGRTAIGKLVVAVGEAG
jgi:NADPH2:quinone reductase